MQDEIEPARNVDEVGHVVIDKNEAVTAEKVFNILDGPGDELVHTDDLEPLVEKPLAQMRTEEARAAGYQCTLTVIHEPSTPGR